MQIDGATLVCIGSCRVEMHDGLGKKQKQVGNFASETSEAWKNSLGVRKAFFSSF
jgi:hypothetical protein